MTFAQIKRQISRPVVAGSVAILLIIGMVAGLAPYRHEVLGYLLMGQLGSERLLVEGLLEEEVSPDEERAEGESAEEEWSTCSEDESAEGEECTNSEGESAEEGRV